MDVKPENIFIGRDEICKLGDFGLVIDLGKVKCPLFGGESADVNFNLETFVFQENLDLKGSRIGDSKYIAPEVITGHLTKAADIFSLGLSILELACDLDLPTGTYTARTFAGWILDEKRNAKSCFEIF